MIDESYNEMLAKMLANARKDLDADFRKREAKDFADRVHVIYDALCESGFSPEEAMQIICTVLRSSINAD